MNPFRLHGTYALFCNIGGSSKFAGSWKELYLRNNQRTNGPVNAHLISLPSKAQNIQNLEKI